MIPAKTRRGLPYLAERTKETNWVLSPSSMRATRLKVETMALLLSVNSASPSSFLMRVRTPKARKSRPEVTLIQYVGMRSAMKPPTMTLAPSTTAKAAKAPMTTSDARFFMDSVITAMWVLSRARTP